MSAETDQTETINDSQQNDQVSDVLLVLDKEKMKIMAVKGLDKEGNLETVEPTKENEDQFMRVDKHGNPFSNLFSNFWKQFKNPSGLKFFKVPKTGAVDMAEKMQEHIKNPNREGEQIMKESEVVPADLNEKMNSKEENKTEKNMEKTTEETIEKTGNRFSVDQIDWETLSNLGWNQEKLEKYNLLDPLLKGYKTDTLVGVSLNLGTAVFRADARLSLQPGEDGKAIFVMHGVRKEPDLKQNFFGHEFTEDDKQNLLTTRNMGRVVNLTKNNVTEPYIISIDHLTNEVVGLKASAIKIDDVVNGVTLSPQQKKELLEAKPVLVKGMISKKKTVFDATLQYNAEKRRLDYRFDTGQNKQQSQNTKSEEQGIPRTFRRKEFTDKQYKEILEGKTLFIPDFVDAKGKKYDGYVTLNKESQKLSFTFDNPQQLREQARPVDGNKTQVAVNSEGKTNEATKKIKEPLKSGQKEPDSKVQKEQQQEEIQPAPAKRRGRRM
ncbi:DUF4099 domain-containing protein [Sphingobacterium sp.]|uniref:DUF4099 domain-containing protein n=1 Tax=Sphingobacterium sp. TaxID=341027 RepID=UPI00258B1C8F|nr:DUF4099 domain-containing protein [Sphingobacterium sp.]WET69104.1 MAG: DUF4099 domain-containing protein [Sphingobacterium sp.]